MQRVSKAFTLIELLIVVAIIAILAAIAVPNFLEAQTRAKISRGKADMRSMGTALEMYRVDNGAYPLGASDVFATTGLTTPVAYMASLPADTFQTAVDWYTYKPFYFYFSSTPKEGSWTMFKADFLLNTLKVPATESGWSSGQSMAVDVQARWQIRSLGPDMVGNWSLPYDATNGTKSAGDISLFGPGNQGIF
jgi:type II secretion system protein G